MTDPGRPSPVDPVTLLGRPVPDGVQPSHHVLDDAKPLVCGRAWCDVFAIVEHGEVDVEAPHGTRLRLIEGDSLCFAFTGPVTLRAVGRRAVLTAVRRSPRPAEGAEIGL